MDNKDKFLNSDLLDDDYEESNITDINADEPFDSDIDYEPIPEINISDSEEDDSENEEDDSENEEEENTEPIQEDNTLLMQRFTIEGLEEYHKEKERAVKKHSLKFHNFKQAFYKIAHLGDADSDVKVEGEKLPQSKETEPETIQVIDERTGEVKTMTVDKMEEKETKTVSECSFLKKAEMQKSAFAKPKEVKSGAGKVIIFLIICVLFGLFIGIKGNSYYNYVNGKVDSAVSCAIGWATVENLPYSLNPFNTTVVFQCALAAALVLGVIGLFVYFENDTNKKSRVGHEHGASHLATKKDFKNYKQRFMDK